MNAMDIMVRDVVTVSPEMPVQRLAYLLTEKKISGAPVLENNRLVGIVTERDLVDRVKKIHLPTLITLLDAVIPIAGERQYENDLRKVSASTVGDIMSTPVTVVEGSEELSQVATLLSEGGVSLLPVVENNHLVGIIGKRDVIRAMLLENGT